jgi:starch synthase
MEVYKNKKAWRRMQQRGMSMDFSWSASAKEYVKLYRQAIETHSS